MTIPVVGARVWQAFIQLTSRRNKVWLEDQDLVAYLTLTRQQFQPWEIAAFFKLDQLLNQLKEKPVKVLTPVNFNVLMGQRS